MPLVKIVADRVSSGLTEQVLLDMADSFRQWLAEIFTGDDSSDQIEHSDVEVEIREMHPVFHVGKTTTQLLIIVEIGDIPCRRDNFAERCLLLQRRFDSARPSKIHGKMAVKLVPMYVSEF